MGRFSRIQINSVATSGGGSSEYVPTIVESTTAITHTNVEHGLGDVLGPVQTLTSMFTEAGFGKIVGVTVSNATGEVPGLDVVFLHSELSVPLDDADVWNVVAGDHDHVLATVPIYASEYVQSGAVSVAEKNPGNVIQATGTSIFAYLVNRGAAYTPVGTSGYDLTVRIEQY